MRGILCDVQLCVFVVSGGKQDTEDCFFCTVSILAAIVLVSGSPGQVAAVVALSRSNEHILS